jgi:hypothetical protein
MNKTFSESLMGMVALKPRRTGLSLEVFVSESTYASQQLRRPSLLVRDRTGNTSATVAFDSPIEVVMGTPITGKAWQALLRYVQRSTKPGTVDRPVERGERPSDLRAMAKECCTRNTTRMNRAFENPSGRNQLCETIIVRREWQDGRRDD